MASIALGAGPPVVDHILQRSLLKGDRVQCHLDSLETAKGKACAISKFLHVSESCGILAVPTSTTSTVPISVSR